MQAIILAAGRGERIASDEYDLPKVMRMACGKPILQYVLHNTSFVPKQNVVLVVGFKKEGILARFGDEYPVAVQEEQLGTGHAVKCAKDVLLTQEDDILVCAGDMPLLTQETYALLVKAHERSGADCTLLTVKAPNSGLSYGRILREEGVFTDIIEYEDCTPEQRMIDELNVGVYVFKGSVLFPMLDQLKLDNAKGEYYLTDIPRLMLKDGKVEICEITNPNEVYGVNTQEELEFCEKILQNYQETEKEEPRWFGTGGWRAIIGDEFTKANIQILSQAIARDMRDNGCTAIVIGHDRRFLSDKAAIWAAEIFAGNEIVVYFISRIAPTPLVMFTVANSGVEYGIAITASHNPAEYNGIKVFTTGGRDADVKVTRRFERIIMQEAKVKSLEYSQGVRQGIIQIIDPTNEYMDRIISLIDMEAIRSRGLRILLDPMFGVSKTPLQTILMTARCDVDIINENHDALFGGRLPSPTATTLARLREIVVEKGYDLGIGTDGDADRIGIIDNMGRFIHPNEIMVMLYYYLMKYKGWRGDCVRNVSTTHILDKIARDFGATCHEVPVGFKNISSKMEETDAIIGGESSGGLTVRGHILGKDGIFASVLITEMISFTQKEIPAFLKEIRDLYGRAEMIEYDTYFSEQKKTQIQDLLFGELALPEKWKQNENIEKVSYMDGCKVYFTNGGWISVRFSGTEPLLRIFCEMETKEDAREITEDLLGFLGLSL